MNIYIQRKLYVENIFNILFDVIAKYLQYDDYYIFYQMFASKITNYLIRTCLYCKKEPICPVNIVLNSKNETTIICNKNLMNPICYICLYENWIFNYNKLDVYTRNKTHYQCPYKCCNLGVNMFLLINNSNKFGYFNYKKLINFDNKWNYLKNIEYYKCKYCGQVFRNKHHFIIYKHYKFSNCRFILKNFENNYFCRLNQNIENIKYQMILNNVLSEDDDFN
jgi:hypothetical protein